jgi:hypothetical protein
MNWFSHFFQKKQNLIQVFSNHVSDGQNFFFFDEKDTISYILLETQSKGMIKTKLISFKCVNYKLEIEFVQIWLHTVFSSNLHNIDLFDKLLEGEINHETIEEMKLFDPVEDMVIYSFSFMNNVLSSGTKTNYFFVHNVDLEINKSEEKIKFDEMIYSFRNEYESGFQPYFFFQDRTVIVTKSFKEDFLKVIATKNKKQEGKNGSILSANGKTILAWGPWEY